MSRRKNLKQATLVVLMVIGLTGLNYATAYRMVYEHAFYRILLYIPLVLGGFWFGIRGAVAIAVSVIALFSPYVMTHWHGFSLEDFHAILEGGLYLAIAWILGILVERERKKHKALVEAESLAAVGRAASEVAHDMKAPLMAIGGFANQVSRGLDLDDPGRKKLDVVIQETARLEHLVKDMLCFGRPVDLQVQRIDLNHLVQEVVDGIRPVAEKTQVVLDTDLDPLLPPLMLDGPKIQQALLNLVMNAIEASPGGEHVLVKTAGERQGVSLCVTDGGPGIDPEDVENIFKPFFTKKSKGTGLGLPIVKKIVEAHHGEVSLCPNPESGVTFTATFPAPAD